MENRNKEYNVSNKLCKRVNQGLPKSGFPDSTPKCVVPWIELFAPSARQNSNYLIENSTGVFRMRRLSDGFFQKSLLFKNVQNTLL